MFKLFIGNQEYQKPEKLTVSQWSRIAVLEQTPENYWRVISIALNVPEEQAILIPVDTATLGYQFIMTLMSPTDKQYKTIHHDCKLLDFNTITLGQFIDLEVYITQDFNGNLNKIVSLLYNTTDVDHWYINDVFGATQAYLSWRSLIYHSYKNLFEVSEKSEESTDQVSIPHVWLDITMTLADGRFLDMDPVLEKPLIQAFNWLAWNKDTKRKQHDLSTRN